MRTSPAARIYTYSGFGIVVAIIAILAAIASNLEAQTRAKVSRVKNDMRDHCHRH